jgi:hypothetical protein
MKNIYFKNIRLQNIKNEISFSCTYIKVLSLLTPIAIKLEVCIISNKFYNLWNETKSFMEPKGKPII